MDTGASVGQGLGVAVGGIDVAVGGIGVAVGPDADVPHEIENNTTSARLIVSCPIFLRFIRLTLSFFRASGSDMCHAQAEPSIVHKGTQLQRWSGLFFSF